MAIIYESGNPDNCLVIPDLELPIRVRQCRIEFTPQSSDYKDGVFGFTELSNSLIQNCESDVEALKREFTPVPLEIEGDEYYPSWISIRQGQTITLKLKWKKESVLEEYDRIAFDPHDDFTFSEPDELRDATKDFKKGLKEIRITCNATNTAPARLKIKAHVRGSSQVVGVLNVFYPDPKSFNVQFVAVETKTDGSDRDEIDDVADIQQLRASFQAAFNPMLLDVNFHNNAQDLEGLDISNLATIRQQMAQEKTTRTQELSEVETTLAEKQEELRVAKENPEADVSELTQTISQLESQVSELNVTKLKLDSDFGVVNYNDDRIYVGGQPNKIQTSFVGREILLERLKILHQRENGQQINDNVIYVYLTNLECNEPNTTNQEKVNYKNGISKGNVCVLFLGNNENKPYKEVPHEVMHSLGLPHTFPENTEKDVSKDHIFKQTKTDNYMDYNNTAKHTYKWQWQRLHNSNLTQ
ncbi:hypothetical protein AAG747_10645 [Rapidithrix thailandica]|uniref:Uncharacterized protein n=1 Tax=Rapidithrix thailandica TaxID=413964 RepID=A0AAW9S7I1_9BACT